MGSREGHDQAERATTGPSRRFLVLFAESKSTAPAAAGTGDCPRGGRGRLQAAGNVLFTGEKNQKPPGLVTQSVARPPDEPANV